MKRLRCAIYTRKSSEEGLDQAFNSLDAQREACEAYIKSQAGEGWTAVKTHYDDGGISGGTLERPALKRLLNDIEAGRVNVVVVYKVDRLTRSLADFAKIVEIFDTHGVSFVSITQQFNTTTSMGRLTLNMLLSFAQFEREVTGERIRDKIAASKKKGMWMGGMVPLGYDKHPDPKMRGLVVNDQSLMCSFQSRTRPSGSPSPGSQDQSAKAQQRQAPGRRALHARPYLQAALEPDLPRRGRAQGRALSRRARGHDRPRDLGCGARAASPQCRRPALSHQ